MAHSDRKEQSAVSTLEGAVERMVALEVALPVGDGVGYFNKLYLAVSRAVTIRLVRGEFEHPEFLELLAVRLSNDYFSAVDGSGKSPGVGSPAWAPLLQARGRTRVAPIQFVLAGMNAHINYDVPCGVVETCESLGISPQGGSAEHRDYLQLNAIVREQHEEVKRWLATGLLGVLDRALGRLDDVIASFSVVRAREASWAHSKILWQLRTEEDLRGPYLDALGHTVGFAGRGLLVPTLLGIGGWTSTRRWLPTQVKGLLGARDAR